MNSDEPVGELRQWLAMPMEPGAREAIERVRRAEDVVHVAVMPDVHVAGDVCVGTAMATRRLIYPAAVGGDIGCGMLAMAFDASADVLRDAESAGKLLRAIGENIPAVRRHRSRTLALPAALDPAALSHPALAALARPGEEGRLQFGTLGGGNHFIELQADGDDRLWLMIHSGSRAMGQEVKRHHVARASRRSAGMPALDAEAAEGQAYLADQQWARTYAEENRRAMGEILAALLRSQFRIEPVAESMIGCDHNHVRREEHFGQMLFVHRKGAMPADRDAPGIVPGSMGTRSFHVAGLGCADSLRSSAHGAGRLFSRHQARRRFGAADVRRQMRGVWFDPRIGEVLREESPAAYKNVEAVMRAQQALVAITRVLRPLLVFKGR
jgi:tRNA-splicing ligase RtcB (3'-phosphate/5'-hydroxy nucleic acid ligase)